MFPQLYKWIERKIFLLTDKLLKKKFISNLIIFFCYLYAFILVILLLTFGYGLIIEIQSYKNSSLFDILKHSRNFSAILWATIGYSLGVFFYDLDKFSILLLIIVLLFVFKFIYWPVFFLYLSLGYIFKNFVYKLI